MDLNEQKQQFSHAFVRAVVARCGLAYAVPETDDDSIDATLALRGGSGTVRSPKLDLQLKCTASITLTPTHLPFALPIKNYNELRPINVQVPRILVVVLVPDDITKWMDCKEAEFALRQCAYWASLRGLPDTTNTTTETVHLARNQVFDPMQLDAIFARLKLGQLP
jgi:hypothetical protein